MKIICATLLFGGLALALLSDSHLVSALALIPSIGGYLGAVYFERKEDKLNAVRNNRNDPDHTN